MLGKILTQSLPGGTPVWQALGMGLNYWQEEGIQSSTVVELTADQPYDPTSPPAIGGNNPFNRGGALNPRVAIVPRGSSSTAWTQEDIRSGLQRAKLLPHIAGSALASAPQLSYQLFQPINGLSNAIASPFRRGTLPRVTGLEGLPTLSEMVADARAAAYVASGFIPPPPWKPEATALGAIAGALGIWGALNNMASGLWGLLNGPPRTQGTTPTGFGFITVTGNYSPTGITNYSHDGFTFTGDRLSELTGQCIPYVDTSSPVTNGQLQGFNGQLRIDQWGPNICSGTFGIRLEYFNTIANAWQSITGMNGGNIGYEFMAGSLSFSTTAQDSTPLDFGQTASPWTSPSPLIPSSSAAVASAPAVAIPAPTTTNTPTADASPDLRSRVAPTSVTTVTTVAGVPTSAVGVGTASTAFLNPGGTRFPVPAAAPATTPVTPFGPVPLPAFPTADPSRPPQQIDPSGALVTAPAAVPTVTPPDVITPWPGAPSIGGGGRAPAATIAGIAAEVGKIEQKIELMMTPDSPGNLVDKLDNLGDLIGPIVQAILAATSGTTYGLTSPCEVDADGNLLPAVEVEAPGALTQFGAILNRIDAIAGLIQVHKNLKQPNCKPKPPTGEFVTVNFEQID